MKVSTRNTGVNCFGSLKSKVHGTHLGTAAYQRQRVHVRILVQETKHLKLNEASKETDLG
jgi:hypothetical protein